MVYPGITLAWQLFPLADPKNVFFFKKILKFATEM